jgi:predicted metal-dependent phosphoesterase TrpH
MEGAYRAQELAVDYGIDVIPGCEISTKQGHLLALFIEKPIAKGLSVFETIARVGDQGGVCIAAHPMAPHVPALKWKHVLQILKDPDLRQILVGIETLNAGLPYSFSNRLAAKLCADVGLAATGSSDAHLSWTIGDAVTEFPGATAADLRTALLAGTTRAVTQVEKKGAVYYGSNVYHVMRRLLGWTIWAPQPGGAYQWRRLAEVRELSAQLN